MFTTYENIYNKDGQKREFSSVKVQMKFVKVIPNSIYVWSVLEIVFKFTPIIINVIAVEADVL